AKRGSEWSLLERRSQSLRPPLVRRRRRVQRIGVKRRVRQPVGAEHRVADVDELELRVLVAVRLDEVVRLCDFVLLLQAARRQVGVCEMPVKTMSPGVGAEFLSFSSNAAIVFSRRFGPGDFGLASGSWATSAGPARRIAAISIASMVHQGIAGLRRTG